MDRRTCCHRAGRQTSPRARPAEPSRHFATGPATRSVHPTEPSGFPMREHAMGDKSPRQSMTKKATGKSIKEKRLDKKAKNDHTSQMESVVHAKKH